MGKKPDMVMMNYNAVAADGCDLNDLMGSCAWLIKNLDYEHLNDDAKEAIGKIKNLMIKRGSSPEWWEEITG